MSDQQPIDDALLGKFLAGETDPAESARVRAWLARREDNQAETSQDDFGRFERLWEAAEPNKTEVDTDAAWRSVRQKMRTTDRNPVSRNEPIIKPLPVQSTKSYRDWNQTILRVAAVLALVASFGGLLYKFRTMSHRHPAEGVVTLVTNNQKISKTLPDGTHILLNSHSILTYPVAFADDRREVTLVGEAFFEVTPDASRPFRIDARKSVVQVLGTSFSVRAYDDNVSVAVRTGKVRFSRGRNKVLLTKNQQATFEESGDTIRRMTQLSPNVFAYKTGQLVFDNEPLRDVIQSINQFYNADVRLANDQLGNCRLTTRFDKTSLDDVLAVTAETLSLHVRHEGRQVILDGTGCR
ncbi:FecR domain-containing protein [Spirosoma foliorum]|uniref:FecR domain-containing protein n=1 Tax=Spirosoma foliorum TaxID=2710596 RepID=A0A7G5H3X3_9BACT|nr:FecR domain-containing protein [Spirosoma foliorum]QMW05815.1 FecR domain-containing protein [Spirosoma foliorum]